MSLALAQWQVDSSKRIGGERRGAESVRVHPFFWGLDWAKLEQRELHPPHAAFCAAKGAARVEQFASMAPAEPPPPEPAPADEDGAAARGAKAAANKVKERAQNAAVAAMDKLLGDLSDW